MSTVTLRDIRMYYEGYIVQTDAATATFNGKEKSVADLTLAKKKVEKLHNEFIRNQSFLEQGWMGGSLKALEALEEDRAKAYVADFKALKARTQEAYEKAIKTLEAYVPPDVGTASSYLGSFLGAASNAYSGVQKSVAALAGVFSPKERSSAESLPSPSSSNSSASPQAAIQSTHPQSSDLIFPQKVDSDPRSTRPSLSEFGFSETNSSSANSSNCGPAQSSYRNPQALPLPQLTLSRPAIGAPTTQDDSTSDLIFSQKAYSNSRLTRPSLSEFGFSETNPSNTNSSNYDLAQKSYRNLQAHLLPQSTLSMPATRAPTTQDDSTFKTPLLRSSTNNPSGYGSMVGSSSAVLPRPVDSWEEMKCKEARGLVARFNLKGVSEAAKEEELIKKLKNILEDLERRSSPSGLCKETIKLLKDVQSKIKSYNECLECYNCCCTTTCCLCMGSTAMLGTGGGLLGAAGCSINSLNLCLPGIFLTAFGGFGCWHFLEKFFGCGTYSGGRSLMQEIYERNQQINQRIQSERDWQNSCSHHRQEMNERNQRINQTNQMREFHQRLFQSQSNQSHERYRERLMASYRR